MTYSRRLAVALLGFALTFFSVGCALTFMVPPGADSLSDHFAWHDYAAGMWKL